MNVNTIEHEQTQGIITETDLGRALQEAALLVHVKISTWDSVKTDRKVMEDVKSLHNAKGDVGRLMKNTLAGVDAPVKTVRSAYAAVRVRHYELTLPWTSDPSGERRLGPRLLPHPLFMRYIKEIGEKKRFAEASLESFLPKYPELIEQAKPNLGRMFNMTDYPGVDEIRAKFRVYQDFEPIPDGAGFRGLPTGFLDRLSKHLAERQKLQAREANAAMWHEAKTRISHLVERLSDADASFKEATVRNVRELCTLLPGWNITGDHRALDIALEIEEMLAGVDAQDLRKDPAIRKGLVDEARQVVEKLNAWGF
jgi:hypothetical protein